MPYHEKLCEIPAEKRAAVSRASHMGTVISTASTLGTEGSQVWALNPGVRLYIYIYIYTYYNTALVSLTNPIEVP